MSCHSLNGLFNNTFEIKNLIQIDNWFAVLFCFGFRIVMDYNHLTSVFFLQSIIDFKLVTENVR